MLRISPPGFHLPKAARRMPARRFSVLAVFLLAGLVSMAPAAAQEFVRVPQDFSDLQDALDFVRLRGGTVEIAAGTYTAPNSSFRLRHTRDFITVKAAAGAQVILDGGGTRPVFRFENDERSRSQRVSFEGLTFRNGFSDEELVAGAVTLVAAEAGFLDCAFENSRSEAPTTGGGGVLAASDSDVVFIDSLWDGNTALNRGGGMAVLFSRIEIQGGAFDGNRTNVPGHAVNAAGGGIFLLDSKLRVIGTRFEGNEAAFTGGGIFVLGDWLEPLTTPTSEVQIFDGVFRENRVVPDAGVIIPGGTSGGAIHVEDHATVRIYRSFFERNEAEFGGALDNYRGIVEIHDSVFQDNRAVLDRSNVSAGGTFFMPSVDFADASTEFGAVNRRPSELSLTGSLVQGSPTGAATGENGGCLFAAGDLNRLFGIGGVAQDGTAESNRARVTIESSAFAGCFSEAGSQAGSGFGGAINTRLVELEMTDSLVLDSRCLADNCGGGGLALFGETRATISGSTFAGNGADRGGALFLSGSEIDLDQSFFFDNAITEPDGTTNIINSRGAAIHAIPGFNAANPEQETDVTGSVTGCTFANNAGVPIFDVDTDGGPINTVVYNGNQFFSPLFGGKVYVNNLVRAAGETVPELNALVVQRAGAPSTDKATSPNTRLNTEPALGHVLATPRQLFGGAGPVQTFLPFAWSGGTATLRGQALGTTSGVEDTAQAGGAILRVGAANVSEVEVGAESCSIGPLLCLRDDRFTLAVDWERTSGLTGVGQGVQLTPDTGYFFFFNPDNVEMVVKALFGCPQTGNFWVFAGGLTNVKTEIRVTDSLTGFVSDYANPQSTPFQPIQDTGAFPTCDVQGLTGEAASFQWQDMDEPLQPFVGASTLVLDEGRFEVDVTFETPNGQSGDGQAVQLTRDTGYFFFFNENNVEMVVKVLRGCPINGNYWVFAGGLTNVSVEMTVTDTEAGVSQVYTNPQRAPFQPIQDTGAFPTCP